MAINKEKYVELKQLLSNKATLVAVSKTKPVEDIIELYNQGQRHFGENYVQELIDKQAQLPPDIQWHFIGHLQSNKVKSIAPFIHLIHGVDSENLLKEIDKQAQKNNRIINCLLQIHIAKEETKFGLNEIELMAIHINKYPHVLVRGLMGMASFTNNNNLIKTEFKTLKKLFEKYASLNNLPPTTFNILSMGMSSDYAIALQQGSTMVRIGSLLFGERNYKE